MVDNIQRIKAFISSPGDLVEERDLIEEVCRDINDDIGDLKNFRVEAIRWEKNAFSGVGNRSQEVISSQLPDYDIYVGIMGFYFGSNTGVFSSGTQEEFENALARHLKTGLPKIQFYFSDAKISPRQLDLAQLEKVNNFKKSIGSRGIFYRTFEDLTQLKILVRRGIQNQVIELLDNGKGGAAYEAVNGSHLSYGGKKPYDTLKHLNDRFSNDPAVSSSFLSIEAAKHLESFTARLKNITIRIMGVTKSIDRVSKDLNAITSGKNLRHGKLLKGIDRLTGEMESFVYWWSFELSKLDEDFMNGMSTFQRSCLILKTVDHYNSADVDQALECTKPLEFQLSELRKAVEFSSKAMESAMGIGPRWDGVIKIYSAIGADLNEFLDRAVSTIIETRKSIQQG